MSYDLTADKSKSQATDGQPAVSPLRDRTPVALQTCAGVTTILAALSAFCLLLSYFPLWHTDLWGHLAYGRWILEHGSLPATEPLLPLSDGVPMVDSAWLSQVLGVLIVRNFGTPGLQFAYACCIATVAGCLAFALYSRTRHHWIALISVFLFYWCDYQQLLIIRPQLPALVCFVIVFIMVTSLRWRAWYMIAIPAVFVLWANLHGSFIVGLAVLGAVTCGHAVDVLRRSKDLRFLLADRALRRRIYTLELSAIAVLVNPYGLALYPEILAISRHPNMESLVEWEPLTLRMKQGQAAAVLLLALIFVYRYSPRRIRTSEVLIIFGLGLGMLWTSRMIVWWAPVTAYYIGLHAAAVWRVWMKSRPSAAKRSFLYTIAVIGLLWITFAYSPLGNRFLHGVPSASDVVQRDYVRSLGRQTPLEATDYLNSNPPQGLVFNTYEWGDYLLWAGPPKMQLFVASHVHLIPEEVWQQYLSVSRAEESWQGILDRYGVNTIVIDAAKQRNLAERIEAESEVWHTEYRSRRTAIYSRNQPIR